MRRRVLGHRYAIGYSEPVEEVGPRGVSVPYAGDRLLNKRPSGAKCWDGVNGRLAHEYILEARDGWRCVWCGSLLQMEKW